MKKISILLFAVLLSLVACGEKEDFTNAEVEINCTGTYLNIDDLYYKVCNKELIQDKMDGDIISVNIKHLDECEGAETGICLLAFPNEGFVEINYQY